MKQIFMIALCMGIAGCVGPSKHSRSFDKHSTKERKADQQSKSGVRISGEARIGAVYGN